MMWFMEKQDKKGRMTIDELARKVQENFLEMMGELRVLRHDMGGMRGEINGLKSQVNVIEHKVDGVQAQVAGVDRRIDDIALNKVGYKELEARLAKL